MAGKGTVTLSVIGDVEQAKAKFRELGIEVESFGTKTQSSGEKLANLGEKMNRKVTLPIVAGIGLATKAASDLEQSVGAIESIFGEAKGPIEEFGKTAAESAGLSKRQVNEMASVLGAQLQGMGIEAGEAAGKVIDLEKRGADMAATFGGPTSDAVNAISALLRGERDTIERYGVTLKDADIKARILAMGLDTSSVAAEKKAVALASLNLLMEQTAKTEGAFAREQDTTAGATARAKAAIENSAASLGANLLPIAAQAADKVAFLAEQFGNLPTPIQNAILALGGLAAAAGPVLTLVGNINKLRDALVAMNLAAKVSNLPTTLATLGKFGLGVAGAAATVYVLKQAFDDSEDAADSLKAKLVEAGGAMGDAGKQAIAAFLDSKGVLDMLADAGITVDDVMGAVERGGSALQDLATGAGITGKDFIKFADATGDVAQAMRGAETKTADYNAVLGETVPSLDETGDAAEKAGRKIKSFGDKVDEAVDSTFDLARAQRSVEDLYEDLTDTATDAANERADAEERVADAIESSSRRIRDAKQDLADAEEDLQKIASGDRTDARRRVRDAAQDVADAEADGAESIADAKSEQDELNDSAEEQLDTVEKIGEGVAEVVKEMVEEGAKASEIRRYLDEQKQLLIDHAAQLGINRAEVEKILALWQEIAGLTGPATPPITQSADSLERQAQQDGGFGYAGPGGVVLQVFTADNPDEIARAVVRELVLHGGRR